MVLMPYICFFFCLKPLPGDPTLSDVPLGNVQYFSGQGRSLERLGVGRHLPNPTHQANSVAFSTSSMHLDPPTTPQKMVKDGQRCQVDDGDSPPPPFSSENWPCSLQAAPRSGGSMPKLGISQQMW